MRGAGRFTLLLIAGLALSLGCGPHRITFVNPSLAEQATTRQERVHAHGIGPLLVGGGGFFAIVNEMSPALIDYNGSVNAAAVCPNGFASVSHAHGVGHGILSAVISWIILVNASHNSRVTWECLPKP